MLLARGPCRAVGFRQDECRTGASAWACCLWLVALLPVWSSWSSCVFVRSTVVAFRGDAFLSGSLVVKDRGWLCLAAIGGVKPPMLSRSEVFIRPVSCRILGFYPRNMGAYYACLGRSRKVYPQFVVRVRPQDFIQSNVPPSVSVLHKGRA